MVPSLICTPVPLAHHFTRTGQGQQLLFDQVHGNCSDSGSILERSLHSGGKSGPGDMLAVGTLFLLDSLFSHHQTRRRYIDAPFDALHHT
jgi:hypothetical protein